jgi:hypothetical protein
MTTNQSERPRFYEGQYLGAEDMTAALEYSRIQQARHSLGGHTWGIATGLQLREVASPSGDKVDVYVQPGYAWDGFGRPIVVLSPYKLPVDMFKNKTSGAVKVWLRYKEQLSSEPASGFEICGNDNQFSRIQESFEVEIGDLGHSDQHESITVAGKTCDALDVSITLDTADTLLCDESVPFQSFPDMQSGAQYASDEPVTILNKSARWLIPLGYVNWNQGSDGEAGYFKELTDAGYIKKGRCERQYIGVVAEGIFAADGVIRLRGRGKADPSGLKSLACENDRLKDSETDLSYKDDELSVVDLVWVEGNLRAKGDIKLFGTKLDFRDASGRNNNVPLEVQRIEDNGAADSSGKKGRDLQITLGQDMSGQNRLSVGALDGNKKFDAKVVVTDSGKVGVKTKFPKNALDVSGEVVIGANYAGTASSPANGLLVEGQVGIGVTNPDGSLTINGTGQSARGKLTIFSADADFVYDGGNDGLFVFKDLGGKTAFMGGNIGIGTSSPRNRLGIRAMGPSEELISFEDSSGATKWHINQNLAGNNPGLNFVETGVEDGRLFIKRGGNVGIGTTNPVQTLDVKGRIARQGQDFSISGTKNNNNTVSVPWGTTNDWNIFVSPEIMGLEETDSEGDNALLKIECKTTKITDTTWKITARYKFKYSNVNPSNGVWENGSANYILIPK